MHGHIQKKDLVAFLMVDNLGGGRWWAELLWQPGVMLMFFCSIIIVCIEDRPETQSPSLNISSFTSMRAACCSQSNGRQPSPIASCNAKTRLLGRKPYCLRSCWSRLVSIVTGPKGSGDVT